MEELTSINELAKEVGTSKSTMNYYATLGIIAPISVVGKMQLFDKKECLRRIAVVKQERRKGKTLKQIVEKMK